MDKRSDGNSESLIIHKDFWNTLTRQLKAIEAAPEMLKLLEEMLHNNHISDEYSEAVYNLIKKAGSHYKK